MTKLQGDLQQLKFERMGDIKIHRNGGYPHFVIDDPVKKKHGHVYMWVLEKNKQPREILYIGRAGKTLKSRCNQHLGGFRGGSNSGKRNAEVILLKLKEKGASIGVYSRYSRQLTILGQRGISLSHAEEAALIQKYKEEFKLLNVAK
jgi:hypothetical protein